MFLEIGFVIIGFCFFVILINWTGQTPEEALNIPQDYY